LKQHITTNDLENLSIDQMEKLRYLWIPEKYDLVSTKICKDAENDIYDTIEFVVGNINIDNNGIYSNSNCSVSLQDICSMSSSNETDLDSDLDDEGETDVISDDIEENDVITDDETDTDSEELNYELENYRPSIFGLEDCLPLLRIGNMIEILLNNKYDYNNFSIDIIQDKHIFSKSSKGYDDYKEDFESSELCDVLWQAVLELL
jgi:hypothetical protein